MSDAEHSLNVVLVGATGLVGARVLHELLARNDVKTTVLVRRAGVIPRSERLSERVFAFNEPEAYDAIGREFPCDALICCIGTTLKKAGSAEGFKRVDRNIPLALIARQKGLGHGVMGLVSSVGADRPRGLYLQTKAEVEQALVLAGIPAVVVRPSLLLGKRPEFRLAERMAEALSRPLFWLLKPAHKLIPVFSLYAPIDATLVAQTLTRETLALAREPMPGVRVLEGARLRP